MARTLQFNNVELFVFSVCEMLLEGDRGNATIEIIDSRTGQPLTQSTDLAHPYYWAPFILIGNGL